MRYLLAALCLVACALSVIQRAPLLAVMFAVVGAVALPSDRRKEDR